MKMKILKDSRINGVGYVKGSTVSVTAPNDRATLLHFGAAAHDDPKEQQKYDRRQSAKRRGSPVRDRNEQAYRVPESPFPQQRQQPQQPDPEK